MKSLTIPESIVYVSIGAFSGCKSLETVILPDTVQTVGDKAFANCTNLKTVEYFGTLDAAPYRTSDQFSGCTKLEPIHVPMNYIGEEFCGIEIERYGYVTSHGIVDGKWYLKKWDKTQ